MTPYWTIPGELRDILRSTAASLGNVLIPRSGTIPLHANPWNEQQNETLRRGRQPLPGVPESQGIAGVRMPKMAAAARWQTVDRLSITTTPAISESGRSIASPTHARRHSLHSGTMEPAVDSLVQMATIHLHFSFGMKVCQRNIMISTTVGCCSTAVASQGVKAANAGTMSIQLGQRMNSVLSRLTVASNSG